MAQSETNSAEERMTAYLDHEMDDAESEAFEAMLADSPETQEELDELRQVLQLVSSLPKLEAPADFFEKVAKKIRRRKLLSGEIPVFVALSFQVISVIVVLVIAAVYTMIHLDRDPAAKLEKDPKATASGDVQGEPEASGGAAAELMPAPAAAD